MGLGVMGFSDALARLQADIMVVFGDRYEIFAAAQAAMTAKLFIVHIHGGETTAGAIDEAKRHAISIIARTDFVSTELARQQLWRFGIKGEEPFVVGGFGIKALVRVESTEHREVLSDLGLPANARQILLAFHLRTGASRKMLPLAAEYPPGGAKHRALFYCNLSQFRSGPRWSYRRHWAIYRYKPRRSANLRKAWTPLIS